MTDTAVVIRRMDRKEVGLAVAWAAQEGWNPGLHDADSFYAADPNGFFLAESTGQPVGCISAVAYDHTFGFMGLYMVRKDLRTRGIGGQLARAGLEYMGDRTIGGDAVAAMLDKYAEGGFRIAHYNARYEGVGVAFASSLTDLRAVPFAELARYDRRFFPAPRDAFLEAWVNQPGSRCLAFMDGGRLAGYGVIRPCHRGFKVAPLFADTPDIAEELFASLCSFAAGEAVFVDIPVCNRAASALVERHRMGKVFETARMYRGPAPALALEDTYGITSFELG